MNVPESDTQPVAEVPRPLSAVESRPSAQRVRQDVAIYVTAYLLTLGALFALIWFRSA